MSEEEELSWERLAGLEKNLDPSSHDLFAYRLKLGQLLKGPGDLRRGEGPCQLSAAIAQAKKHSFPLHMRASAEALLARKYCHKERLVKHALDVVDEALSRLERARVFKRLEKDLPERQRAARHAVMEAWGSLIASLVCTMTVSLEFELDQAWDLFFDKLAQCTKGEMVNDRPAASAAAELYWVLGRKGSSAVIALAQQYPCPSDEFRLKRTVRLLEGCLGMSRYDIIIREAEAVLRIEGARDAVLEPLLTAYLDFGMTSKAEDLLIQSGATLDDELYQGFLWHVGATRYMAEQPATAHFDPKALIHKLLFWSLPAHVQVRPLPSDYPHSELVSMDKAAAAYYVSALLAGRVYPTDPILIKANYTQARQVDKETMTGYATLKGTFFHAAGVVGAYTPGYDHHGSLESSLFSHQDTASTSISFAWGVRSLVTTTLKKVYYPHAWRAERIIRRAYVRENDGSATRMERVGSREWFLSMVTLVRVMLEEERFWLALVWAREAERMGRLLVPPGFSDSAPWLAPILDLRVHIEETVAAFDKNPPTSPGGVPQHCQPAELQHKTMGRDFWF
mmetsp:Transcript_8381/g.35069  ORF Transcript_8381/g.35069 Transcript_8381/m.35069 type:complete len:566 (+) Transcript_8381:74-1771(+)